MNKRILSPLTNSSNITLEEIIPTDFLIKRYKECLNVDTSNYFQGLKKIRLYRCKDTNYRFYYPFNINGDGEFYEKLEKFPWYYMPWKWEHQIVMNSINSKDNVLEIGCGPGGFLKKVEQKGARGVGLEFNKSAVEVGKKKKLNILNEPIQEHAKKFQDYSFVCSFQVLEHIATPREFIQASIDALRPGGKLVLSVPNADSLIFKNNPDMITNMPPHHMGLWDINSLLKLQKIFDITIDSIYFEPLQKYHIQYLVNFLKERLKNKLLYKNYFLKSILLKLGMPFVQFCGIQSAKYINGHTVIVIYIKNIG